MKKHRHEDRLPPRLVAALVAQFGLELPSGLEAGLVFGGDLTGRGDPAVPQVGLVGDLVGDLRVTVEEGLLFGLRPEGRLPF